MNTALENIKIEYLSNLFGFAREIDGTSKLISSYLQIKALP